MLKTLASCKPSEFLAQTNKIRKIAEKWLKNTDLMNIRSHKPKYPEGASEEEKKKILQDQVKENLSRMLDAILEQNAEETLELLALVCFVEPKNVDDHPMSEYIMAVTELLNDKAVLGFFTSLMRLGQTNT